MTETTRAAGTDETCWKPQKLLEAMQTMETLETTDHGKRSTAGNHRRSQAMIPLIQRGCADCKVSLTPQRVTWYECLDK